MHIDLGNCVCMCIMDKINWCSLCVVHIELPIKQKYNSTLLWNFIISDQKFNDFILKCFVDA